MRNIIVALAVLVIILPAAALAETREYAGRWKHPVYGCGLLDIKVENGSVVIETDRDTQRVQTKLEGDTLVFSRFSRERGYWTVYRIGPYPGDVLTGTVSGAATSNVKFVAKNVGKAPTCQDPD